MDKKEAQDVVRQACALVVANLETHQKIQNALEIAFMPDPIVEEEVIE